MEAFNNKITKIFCIVTAVLLIALFVCQFLPFWTVEDKTISMNGYIWFPEKNGAISAEFKGIMRDGGYLPDKNAEQSWINWLALWPVMQTIFILLGTLLHIKAKGHGFMLLFPIACGVSGILGFTRHPILQMGSTWVIQLVLSIVMIVVAAVGLVLMIKKYVEDTKALEAKLAEARAAEAAAAANK